MRILFTLVLALLTLGPPAQAQGAAATEIDRILGTFAELFNARDMQKLAALYADDAVWMPQNSPMVRGRAAIAAVLEERFTAPGVLRFTGVTVSTSGTLAVAAATYTVTVPGQGGAPLVFTAKALTVFTRVGNQWKIAYDMQNADQPPPPG